MRFRPTTFRTPWRGERKNEDNSGTLRGRGEVEGSTIIQRTSGAELLFKGLRKERTFRYEGNVERLVIRLTEEKKFIGPEVIKKCRYVFIGVCDYVNKIEV